MKRRALFMRSERSLLKVLCIALMLCSNLRVITCGQNEAKGGQVFSVCDDGVTGLNEDLEDVKCHGDPFSITYDFPAGHSECTEHTQDATHVCMSSPITYNVTPPSSGAHRMIWPRYGEYDYVPPQRWVHSLEHGAVAFLYHPCTPEDQVVALRRLATSCLWKHIITAYPHLDNQYPLALVSWGCVYRMSWVDVRTAEAWIQQHALHSPEAHVTQDGTYDHGLQHAAAIVSDAEDSNICPQHHQSEPDSTPETAKPTTTTTTGRITDEDISSSNTSTHEEISSVITELPDEGNPTTETTPNETITVTYRKVHGLSVLGLTLLTGTVAILLVCGMLCLLWRRYPPRKRYGRYKSFLPMSLRADDGSIAIPSIGLPRGNKAEAEILIPDDEDDDEI